MKTLKTPVLIFILFMPFVIFSQVGIGTTTPDASSVLDVTATDKGVLIPRVNLANITTTMLDGTNAAATGLLIYNTNVSVIGGNGVGYYYFNGTIWEQLKTRSSISDHDFYREGTTNAPNSINDDIYTQGNVAIGKTIANYALDIIDDSDITVINARLASSNNLVTSVLNIENFNTGNIGKTGITTGFNGSANGSKTGLHNNITNTGSGNQTGVSNHLTSSADESQAGVSNYIENSGNGRQYGVLNSISGTGVGSKYGSYNTIDASAGGTHYGVYSRVLKPQNYAGFFLGLVSFGTSVTDRYIFPLSPGTDGQIMQTNGIGQLSWENPSSVFNVSNGISEVGGGIVLGGSLTQATTITQGTNNLIFDLNLSGDFLVQDNGINHFEVRSSGITYFGDDSYWNDGNTAGTTIASLIDDGDDGRLRIYENGTTSVDLDANTGFVFNEQGLDRDFRIESDDETSMLRVDANNNRIGIMEATPSFDIHLKQSTRTENGAGGIGLESSDTSNNWKIYHSGTNLSFAENGVRRAYIANTSGLYMDTSDRRLKKNITNVESVLDKVNSLKAYRYLYKDQEVSGKKILGFIAQDIQPLFPELVGQTEDGYFALNYAGFGVIAIKAIQEQQDVIESQQKTIEDLQEENTKTRMLLSKLLQRVELLEAEN